MIRVRFKPQLDITAFELATLLTTGWPVLVDVCTGDGFIKNEFDIPDNKWQSFSLLLPARHFVEVAEDKSRASSSRIENECLFTNKVSCDTGESEVVWRREE